MTEDYRRFKYNVAVAKLMSLTNDLQRKLDAGGDPGEAREAATALVLMLAPLAPHITEELWRTSLGHDASVHVARWPQFDPDLSEAEEVVLVVQVDGKIRDRLTVPAGLDPEASRALALGSEKVQRWLAGREPTHVFQGVGRPGAPRLVNIVTASPAPD